MNKPDDPTHPSDPAERTDPAGSVSGTHSERTSAQSAETTLGNVLRDGSLRHAAPSSLRARIQADLAHAEQRADARVSPPQSPKAAQPSPSPQSPHASPSSQTPTKPARPRDTSDAGWGFRLAPWFFGGAGGAILGGMAVAMALLVARPPAPPEPASVQTATGLQPQEIVASHVRALLSQHPIDVISTDQHTVKPWFNGRLDYAPPVVDLAEKGFPLAGGRLDYVGGRTVAVLVYHTDKHPIDLYVFPARDKTATAPSLTGADGYTIARWRRDGMTYWAITDAEASHLRVFVEALQAAN
ncbi:MULTISPECIES: anti-sigma factor family protein [unclassified Pandoraea]|uniref:anti-sigma factor family protein n=1 Tax=unclassified Pandoraea TaxID=2624094 RepID=UPI000B4058CC|nr:MULTISPECIES: transcriptional regulator [unclassified Pandoraea]